MALGAAGCASGPESPGEPGPSRVTIRGLISIPKSGEPQIVDCVSAVPFTVGRMSPGNLHYLKRRIAELSRRAPGPVTAEFSGHVRKGAKGFRIERPGLVYLAPGRCVDAEELGLDY